MALLSILIAFAATALGVPLEQRADTGSPYLNAAIQSKGKLWFGTAIDVPGTEASDSAYMSVFNNSQIFGEVTPGNQMKWEFVEPSQNSFSFAGGQTTIDLAKATGKKVRCHNLVWHEELPSWVSSGTWTNATLLAAMQNHITKVVEHYGNSCYAWDVVNEALNDDGTWRTSGKPASQVHYNNALLTSTVFYNTIGPAYVPLAFKYARAAAKAVGATIELIYNDYNLEYSGSKQAAAVSLVKQIQAYGANIDGVGFESHFIVGSTPTASTQIAAMKSFTDLGLKIHQTEIDVRFSSLPPTASGLAQQAKDYYNTVSACMQTSACEGVTVWDFDDQYSWIPSTFSGQGDADLYWANLTRKAAYTAVYQAIEGTPCTVCG